MPCVHNFTLLNDYVGGGNRNSGSDNTTMFEAHLLIKFDSFDTIYCMIPVWNL